MTMAQDKAGNAVGFGDYVIVEVEPRSIGLNNFHGFKGVVRIVKLSETPKGTAAVGAFVDLVGNGRIAKMKVDVANSTLVMRSNGTTV
jgi:hypothetical protein